MHSIPSISLQLKPRMYIRGRSRGFSFAEVMFAVVILGIGFIMVAAVFPVAIQQTQNNGEENIAAALARQAANSIASLPTTIKNPIYKATPLATDPPSVSVPTESLFPPTVKNYLQGTDTGASAAVAPPAIVVPFLGNRWDLVKSNLVLPNDPRFAYGVFYKRENNSSAAQLIVVALASRNHPTYDPTVDVSNYPSAAITITTTVVGAYPGAAAANTTICPDEATLNLAGQEGTYLEITSLNATTPAPVGRSYTLGRSLGGTSWELMPADAMALTAGISGYWGTKGAVTDKPCSAQSALLNQTATLQPTVAYAQLFTLPTATNGIIKLDSYAADFASVAAPPILTNTYNPTGGMPNPPHSAVQGAFVIIADDFPFNPTSGSTTLNYTLPDNIVPPAGFIAPAYSVGALNGHVYRIGSPVAGSPGYFNLDSAYGMRPASAGTGIYSPDTVPNPDMCSVAAGIMAQQSCAKVYIIGAGRTNPQVTSGTNLYSGPAQDIGVFSTYFQVQ
jgi:type II secretory pathway pseudopilin PulG